MKDFIYKILSFIFHSSPDQSQQPESERSQPRKAIEEQSSSISALCLILPADIISKFSISSRLNNDDLIYLINSTSYFVCTDLKNTASLEEALERTEGAASPDSKQEFYVKIKIDDGQDMIGKKTPYALKANLPPDAQCTVESLDRLKNLSGLENFNRI